MQAARVAADLRHELGADVQLEDGHYGEFTVLVDGEIVINGGPLAFLGVYAFSDRGETDRRRAGRAWPPERMMNFVEFTIPKGQQRHSTDRSAQLEFRILQILHICLDS